MKNMLLIIISFLLLSVTSSYAKIGIIVNKSIYVDIKASLDKYIIDLKNIEGEDVWINYNNFDSKSTVAALRDSLKWHYKNDNLNGAVLIGDLPICKVYFSDSPSYSSLERTFPTDYYFMDLERKLEEVKSGYYKYPFSRWDLQIWVSRIIPSNLITNLSQAEVINNYFDRVYNRMHGKNTVGRKCLIFVNDQINDSPEWTKRLKGLYKEIGYDSANTTIRLRSNNGEDSKTNYLDALIAGQEFVYCEEHSSPTGHSTTGSTFTLNSFLSAKTNALFHYNHGCSVSRFTTKNLGMAYALQGNGLLSIGKTQPGTTFENIDKYFFESLNKGKSFGESFLYMTTKCGFSNSYPVNYTSLFGVATLKLLPYSSVDIKENTPRTIIPSTDKLFHVKIDGSRLFFTLPVNLKSQNSKISLNIYDVNGKNINSIVLKNIVGSYASIPITQFNNTMSTGVYFVTLTDGLNIWHSKIVLR